MYSSRPGKGPVVCRYISEVPVAWRRGQSRSRPDLPPAPFAPAPSVCRQRPREKLPLRLQQHIQRPRVIKHRRKIPVHPRSPQRVDKPRRRLRQSHVAVHDSPFKLVRSQFGGKPHKARPLIHPHRVRRHHDVPNRRVHCRGVQRRYAPARLPIQTRIVATWSTGFLLAASVELDRITNKASGPGHKNSHRESRATGVAFFTGSNCIG